MSCRQYIRQLQQKAARQGVAQAYRFFDMTPRQVGLCMEACAGQERQVLERLCLQAVYTALAFHAPGRLPSLSSPSDGESMPWEQMKQRLLAWRGKDES